MYPNNNSNLVFNQQLTKVGDDIWYIEMPLPSGVYGYYYTVNGTNARIQDPANLPPTSTTSELHSNFSLVYVPFEEERQEDYATNYDDRSVFMPRTDGQVGTVEYQEYTGADGNQHYLSVYLPYGYDADRAEPYKTLYLSHGGGGNEIEWFNEGNADQTLDNLIAEGYVEPFVVVTMNNSAWGFNYTNIYEDLINNMFPFIEATYNVSTEAEDRAWSGLSAGCSLGVQMYMRHPETFGYMGLYATSQLAAADSFKPELAGDQDLNYPEFYITAGMWDNARASMENWVSQIDAYGIDYTFELMPAAHDWSNWPLAFSIFARDYLWE
jgi:enterochelin esterase-like enzyme